ncbi:FMN-linked oxidoreductase [Leucogyrophana mollusca]|uniref:FMN-linked oxidoreductase n=1 Tax=Leucogyrophana mollusca TaxID=85980 RepID=A0ACB8BSG9_9AGAM|nr:FMN-linked oxidoreductase [Leucogyrophana mollusca]
MEIGVFSPAQLPCGRTVQNRLVKVALYEHLGAFGGSPPNAYHIGLYAEWAKHAWGIVITGNVQVSPKHLTLGRDIIVPPVLDEDSLKPFEALARTIHGTTSQTHKKDDASQTLAIMQLSHAGRQSPNVLGGRPLGAAPLAPSAVRVGFSRRAELSGVSAISANESRESALFYRAMFPVPQEMTIEDIEATKEGFVRGALLAFRSGFDGVQIHVAHGYLLAQFVNPKSNIRQDRYSAEPNNALRLAQEIVEAVRLVVPPHFIVGVKINSADYAESGSSSEWAAKEDHRVLNHIRTIAGWAVDFIEISGGDYEKPDFVSSGSQSTSSRQAFFAEFSKKAMQELKSAPTSASTTPLVLLTGGLRSPSHLDAALAAQHADLLGIGRGAILCPDLPTRLRALRSNSSVSVRIDHYGSDDHPFAREPDVESHVPSWLPRIRLIGAGVGMAWYSVRMRAIAASQMVKGRSMSIKGDSTPAPAIDYNLGWLGALVGMWVWVDWSIIMLLKRLGPLAVVLSIAYCLL